ncbi:MAG TPA: DUF1993 domain-containing protein [Steroidobacteraceae bacterium]|nr:DUF1993 domain-containing protein [Steroidobacteraceae bacterium]
MAVSMYDLSVASFSRTLQSLSGILDKAIAHAAAKKFDGKVLAEARLFPDMFPLSRQVQVACDFAKGCSARLAGVEVPKYEDNETTLEELKARVAKTLDFIATLKPQQLQGSEERTITHEMRVMTLKMPGLQYLTAFALPNFYFHATTAYALLRHNGLELGKRDFIGPV